MINIELIIIAYVLISFLLFYCYSEDVNKEGACTSKPFYFNNKNPPKGKGFVASPGEEDKTTSTQNMISAFVSTMDEIEASMADIKKKIPVKFNLGVVDNTDDKSDISVYGNLPNIFINFLIKNPHQGIKGKMGDDAEPFGPTGKMGPTGTIGEDGYWGTTKDNLF